MERVIACCCIAAAVMWCLQHKQRLQGGGVGLADCCGDGRAFGKGMCGGVRCAAPRTHLPCLAPVRGGCLAIDGCGRQQLACGYEALMGLAHSAACRGL